MLSGRRWVREGAALRDPGFRALLAAPPARHAASHGGGRDAPHSTHMAARIIMLWQAGANRRLRLRRGLPENGQREDPDGPEGHREGLFPVGPQNLPRYS